MNHFTLTNWSTTKTIFKGHFASIKACIETAIAQGIALDYLTLGDADLRHTNLDGGTFSYARFTGCDFTGANLSETSFIKAEFHECILNEVCMADAVAVGARFTNTSWKDSDIRFADLRGILVDCIDFLKSDFGHLTHISGSGFSANDTLCPMNKAPLYIRGLGLDVVLLDTHVVIGGKTIVRRDQLGQSQSGMAATFAKHGLTPDQDTLAQLWTALRGTPNLRQVA